jgi:hypothetical protein
MPPGQAGQHHLGVEAVQVGGADNESRQHLHGLKGGGVGGSGGALGRTLEVQVR